MIFITMRAAQL